MADQSGPIMTLVNKTIIVTPEKPIYGGYCLARHQGKAVLIPHAIPGETVAAAIVEDKNDYCFGTITAIEKKSDSRIMPDCPHFTECGGCSYLHVSYEQELEFKKAVLSDCLERSARMAAGTIPPVDTVVSHRYHYRSHGTLKSNGGNPGFYRKGTNDLVSIRESGCLLLAEELNAWLQNSGTLPGDVRIAVDRAARVYSSIQDEAEIVETAGGLVFSRGINRFFQANRFLRERMQQAVAAAASLGSDESFLDIGCGVGFLSLPLAGSAGTGTGIDISRESIHWASYNARANGIANVAFRTMPSSRIHPGRLHSDVIVADPPRAGMDKKTRNTIIAMKPSRIVYASCNPSTFARDAGDFIAGGYSLDTLTFIDMFPCTHHIELVSRFVLR